MLTPGNVLYGNFKLNENSDEKYCIVLSRDNNNPKECIVTTFTTSKARSVINPVHGKNVHPVSGAASYVFKAGVVVGKSDSGEDFSFPRDSTVVTDYGMRGWEIQKLQSTQGLELKCRLLDEEFGNLLYVLLKSEKVKDRYKPALDSALSKLYE